MVIPAIIQTNESEKNVAISLIENIQREELNPIELAQSFQKLSNEHGLSHEAIASMVGKSRATVTNLLRLLNLSHEVRILLISGKLEMGMLGHCYHCQTINRSCLRKRLLKRI
jgi:ParB family transcriptional regulator, chromosome partitioning protein